MVFTTELEKDHDHQAAEDILASISYQEILEMIRKLSPAYRAVFNLYVIEGYKHEEIAELLNISTGTSKSNLAKAKKNSLRKELESIIILSSRKVTGISWKLSWTG